MRSIKQLALSWLIILSTLLLFNGFLYYSTNCSPEYIESKDVWNSTYITQRTIRDKRQSIIQELPANNEEAIQSLTSQIASLTKYYQAISYINGDSYAARDWNVDSYKTRKEKANSLYQEYITTYHKQNTSPSQLQDEIQQEINLLSTLQIQYEDIESYSKYIDTTIENATILCEVSLFPSTQKWLINNILKCQKDYYALNHLELSFVQSDGFLTLVNYHFTDLIGFLMTLLLVLPAFLLYRHKANSILQTNYHTFVLTAFVLLIGLTGLYLSDILLTSNSLSLPSFSTTLQSITSYRSCPYMITTGVFLILWMISKVAFFLLMAFFLICICTKQKKALVHSIIGYTLIIGFEAVCSTWQGNHAITTFLREINFFSALHFERFFNRYQNLNILGSAVSRLPIFILLLLFLLLISFLTMTHCLNRYSLFVFSQSEEAYYDEINQKYTESRQIRHDMHNHLLAIQSMIERGDSIGANQYINEITEQLSEHMLPMKTGCNVVDALLYKKSLLAKEEQIQFKYEFTCSLRDVITSNYDLCCIFGNMMDNAIEALRHLEDTPRICTLSVHRKNSMLYIACCNPYAFELRPHGTIFYTTKSDSSHHGIGLTRIQQICKKYDGCIHITTDQQLFKIELLLNAWNH